MALSPSKAIAWNSLGLSLYEKGEVENALSAFNTAIQLEETAKNEAKNGSSQRA